MFSVADLLAMPCMERAELIAGIGGINKQILWSHVIEHEDIGKWIGKKVLIISTGVGLRNVQEGLMHVLRCAVRAQAAGLVLSLGEYITNKPSASVLTQANSCDFPIILIPMNTPIISITYEIAQKILNNRSINSIFPEEILNRLNTQYKVSRLKENKELHDTLVTYLDAGGNATQSAQMLYIHLNTMKYRLKKIEDILKCNLRDEETRFMLRCIL